MGDEFYSTVEWSIENFSFWNGKIHGENITSLESSFFNIKFKLFPRGVSGRGDHLMVHICNKDHHTLVGDLSFIVSDGTILCSQQVNTTKGESVLQLPPGPKFERVVARIRNNEALYKDQLTLRFRKKETYEAIECMGTTIDVSDVSVKISPRTFDNADAKGTAVLCVKHLLDDCRSGEMNLLVSKRKQFDSKIELALKPNLFVCFFSVLVNMFVLNNKDAVVRREENEHLFVNDEAWTFSSSLTQEEVKRKGFSILLRFKIPNTAYRHFLGSSAENYSAHPGEVTLVPSSTWPASQKHVDSMRVLKEDFKCLYRDQAFSDFQLKCGGVSFPVHRNILSARSPVFKIMIPSDMIKAGSEYEHIEDLDPSTLGLFLTYLYTGVVDEMQCDSALKLYYAADKYQVPSLKRVCVNFLCDNYSISNVCDILSLADKYQDDQLSSSAHDFILRNYSEVLKSKEWKSFMNRESLLAAETLTHLADKNHAKENRSESKKKLWIFLLFCLCIGLIIRFPILLVPIIPIIMLLFAIISIIFLYKTLYDYL